LTAALVAAKYKLNDPANKHNSGRR